MTSEELAEQVASFIKEAQERVVGEGHRQYSFGSVQKFEMMTLEELFQYMREELLDVVVYANMVAIRIERLKDELVGKERS